MGQKSKHLDRPHSSAIDIVQWDLENGRSRVPGQKQNRRASLNLKSQMRNYKIPLDPRQNPRRQTTRSLERLMMG